MALLTTETLHCVIFNFTSFGLSQVRLIQGICEIAKIPQVLVFAEQANPEVLEAIKNDKNLILIEKPLMNFEDDVAGLCDRLINEDSKFKREARRLTADQPASITLLKTGRHYDGRVRNMNEHGACLEINTSLVAVGDQIKITVDLDKLNRQRIFTAEVRWIKPYPGKSIMGIRFSHDST